MACLLAQNKRQQTSTGQQPIDWRTSDTTSADKKENEQSDALATKQAMQTSINDFQFMGIHYAHIHTQST